ncbi:uncharacterized protein LOC106097219 [Oreochromis niloticus]|uniref:uncharacterized protein LOC106097219 n=1 Tax=Oreochromis niloticus TaxID=8128 RepID=UPI0009050717|nr:uncharacterized protein LOC106097219 [Oreochromis niloticus]XP_025756314.1 uncharacterized protein LOC106097219 [Oreochromis niloticus]XP_025756316.1 uncharacterized protein LOC106097219 [Oreochromis niloticus]XP_025756317.1 uncharacterized protein LOC106097219 [Oreochromis niloticus]XP_025756318.1 uncharacterized protein LOC106097219 [Oreochromis niloticus]XP_025756321.1 uncharacterized protein LOC106097219 [Oreochromis niloticus]
MGKTRAGVYEDRNLAGGILLFTSLLGLVTYICVFFYQRRLIKHIRCPLIYMICVDIVNFFMGITVGSEYLEYSSNCRISCSSSWLSVAWLLTRLYGVILHLLTSAWCLIHPKSESKQCYFFTVISILTLVLSPVYAFVKEVAIYVLGVITIGLALGVIINFRLSAASPAPAKEKKLITTLAMYIFLVVFLPSFILECLFNIIGTSDIEIIYKNALFFTNLQLIFNGLLCFLIMKLSAGAEEEEEEEEEEQQQPQQLLQLQQQQQWQQSLHDQSQQPQTQWPQWQQPQKRQWQQPQHQWEQPEQRQWQPPQQQGWRRDASVFTIHNGRNSH